ncbi:MAG: transcription-repair coupling factor [Vampirovibrionales bacterium]
MSDSSALSMNRSTTGTKVFSPSPELQQAMGHAPKALAEACLVMFTASQWVQHTVLPKVFQAPQQKDAHHSVTVPQVTQPLLKALHVAALFKETQASVLWVIADPSQLHKFQGLLESMLPFDAMVTYPAEVMNPYEQQVWPSEILAQHEAFLDAVAQMSTVPKVFLVSAKSLIPKFRDPQAKQDEALELVLDQEYHPSDMTQWLTDSGYHSVSILLERGEFSRRGDILDIYPMSGDPVRLSFFGDILESIRLLDVETQRSSQPYTHLTLKPRQGCVLHQQAKQTLKATLETMLSERLSQNILDPLAAEALIATVKNQCHALEQNFWPEGLDYYTPCLEASPEDSLTSLASYFLQQRKADLLPSRSVLVWDDWSQLEQVLQTFSDRLAHHHEESLAEGRLLPTSFEWHVSLKDTLQALRQAFLQSLHLDSFTVPDSAETPVQEGLIVPLQMTAPPLFQADMIKAMVYLAEQRRAGYQVVITTDYPQRLLDHAKEQDLPMTFFNPSQKMLYQLGGTVQTLQQYVRTLLNSGDIILAREGLPEGLVFPTCKLIHLTDRELFGRNRVVKSHRDPKARHGQRNDIDRVQSADQLRPGDFVVHQKHGIGQFTELTRIILDGEVREYLSIKYAGQDKLHVPVDQLHLLSRYRGAGGDVQPKLSRMGGSEWLTARKKAEKSVRDIARDLIRLYAIRNRLRGFTFDPDTPWQVEMEEAFPYEETPDQWKAIQDLKADMEQEKPMDRLICGDVGFGKTEVALRGIFKAIMSGKQVAILVPTTILAQQHFNTLAERFAPYPVRIGLLSRFRSPKEQKQVIERLQIGDMDVVVGTHRLLQKDVRFKDLGLLVIDEEHRFGVSHKEKIKQFRAHVDVLAMSATPIPRTLYMSLSGVREMSLINTAPVNRSPVQTFVGPYNPAQIRMAIRHELDRGGQVYVVHNRVQSIYDLQAQLETMMPDVKFGVGHGQLPEQALENVMLDFSEGVFDVLICTTIIESGVNIPNANTMIITDSDRYGLAQLYQLRGRVGRSDRGAYCYCYYRPDKQLTDESRDRLNAIREFNALGSGYQIAMRDMEIRGVGNLLGAEQHGHMVSIGYDLYCQMLKDFIMEEQSFPDDVGRKQVAGSITVQSGTASLTKERAVVDLNVSAYLPDDWVGGKHVKLSEYKRLANIEHEALLHPIREEWIDRFGGKLKEPVENLLTLTQIRIRATELGIPLIRQEEEFLRIHIQLELKQWLEIQAKLPAELGKQFRWLAPIRTGTRSSAVTHGSMPSLVAKTLGKSGKELLKLTDTFVAYLKTHHSP